MKRAQIQLEEETFEALRQRAFQEKKSISGVIRELIHREVNLSAQRQSLLTKDFRFIGAGKSSQGSLGPVSERHDQEVPVELPRKTAYLKDLSRLLRELPELGSEAIALEKDLCRITQEQPSLPMVPPWE
ncbi:MAG: hypothetical protein HY787_05245 [Deltaproteobacteria bacterium]|nr:hypothetical protein [Deltaproteobacteria bacterium]